MYSIPADRYNLFFNRYLLYPADSNYSLFHYICINLKHSCFHICYLNENTCMKKDFILIRIYRFYLEGFREMTLGKTLWLIILVKLFIMFFTLRLFFFPNYLNQFNSDKEKEEHVSSQLIDRAITP